jgi:immunomodulating metalloprotease
MFAQKYGDLQYENGKNEFLQDLNGWHLYARLHILQRAIDSAKKDESTFEAMKNSIGFSQYTLDEYKNVVSKIPNNDWTLISLSFASKLDFRPFFDMYGEPYSTKAATQVESFEYDPTPKVFFMSTDTGYCTTDSFGDFLDKATIEINGTSSWPQ